MPNAADRCSASPSLTPASADTGASRISSRLLLSYALSRALSSTTETAIVSSLHYGLDTSGQPTFLTAPTVHGSAAGRGLGRGFAAAIFVLARPARYLRISD